MKLYSYWRSSASWRVRIVLGLKGIAYEYVPVHLVRGGGEQRGESYTARNPMAQVPTLEWTEAGVTRRLAQSVAIAEYLDATHPEPRLIPVDPFAAGCVRECVEIVNSGTQPLQNISVTQHLAKVAPGTSGDDWNRHWIAKGLGALEARAKDLRGEFLVGDAISLADVYLVPQLYNARRFNVDLSAYPTLCAVEQELVTREPFARAHPNRQPDADVQPDAPAPQTAPGGKPA